MPTSVPSSPEPFTTASNTWPRLMGHNVLSTSGLFGIPLDVAATYIILFTIYGAVLEFSGAGSLPGLIVRGHSGSRAARSRTDRHARRLLARDRVRLRGRDDSYPRVASRGPILKRAGYPKEEAGGAPGRGRHRRHPVTPDAGRGRLPHRRAAQRERICPILIWATAADPALLPGHRAGHRDGCATLPNPGGADRDAARRAAPAALRIPLQLAHRDRRLPHLWA